MRIKMYFAMLLHNYLVLGQDNSAILGPAQSAAQQNLQQEMCQVLADNGGIVDQGLDIWRDLSLDVVLLNYLDANPPDDDWTGRLYRDELINEAVDNFRCIDEDDNCIVGTTCEEYFISNGPWISLALQNVWRTIRAQIKGYDRAIELLEANDQSLAKDIFGRSALGRNRADFDFGAFFSGVFLGVQLVIPALSSASIASTLGALFASRVRSVISDSVIAAADDFFGADPANDATTFINSLRGLFVPLQTAWRGTLSGYMDTGITDIQLQNTNEDTVNFLQNGEFLNMITQTDEQLIDIAAREVIKQVAAPIVAKIWFDQGVEFLRLDESFCDGNTLATCSTLDCGAFRNDNGFPLSASEFANPNCLVLAPNFELPPELPGVLSSLRISPFDIAKNANQCNLSGGSGIFPPADTNTIDFGFPRCTWALNTQTG